MSNLLGFNHSIISRMVRRFRETGSHHKNVYSGWKGVLFIDETRVSLNSPEGRDESMAETWRQIL